MKMAADKSLRTTDDDDGNDWLMNSDLIRKFSKTKQNLEHTLS